MVYEGSGPEFRDRLDSFAVLASWASRQGNERAGFEESGGGGISSSTSARASWALSIDCVRIGLLKDRAHKGGAHCGRRLGDGSIGIVKDDLSS